MRSTQILQEEHQVILAVLDCLNQMVLGAKSHQTIDHDAAKSILLFFRDFSDGCHHQKEEDLLFPALEENGFSMESGPTAVMRHEHVEGRRLVGGISDAVHSYANGDEDACRRFIQYACQYRDMLTSHIEKEDHCLFPMSKQVLTEEDDDTLLNKFHKVEDDAGGDRHQNYIEIGRKLCTRYQVPFPSAEEIPVISSEFLARC